MAIGLIGKKIGMTRVFEASGDARNATVIEVEPNFITQVKTLEKEGYRALQLATGTRRATRVSKAVSGHFATAKVAPGRICREFRLDEAEGKDLTVGGELKVDVFSIGQFVDVTTEHSKGKGFQGGVKRHHFRTQDATHGNSLSHRVLGSTGQNQSPGRVFKGKKMAGQMGNVQRTAQNKKVLRVDVERNLLVIEGSAPGAKNGNLIIKPAVKKAGGKK